jgi:hypothetical protein
MELLPSPHRAERLVLLDLLAGRTPRGHFDAEALLAVTPQALYPYLYWRVGRLGVEVPKALLDGLAWHYRQNALLHLRRTAELRRIGEVLAAAGIRYLVLKGPVLAATVYEDPATRTMIDLDLLVDETAVPRAIAALATIGYSIPNEFEGAELQPGDAPPLVNEQAGLPVIELHALLDSEPDDAWAAVRMVGIGHGVAVPALGREELFAQVVMHASRHHRFEGQLRSLLDVALLLRSQETELDWERLAAEWERRGIAGWIELTIALANALLGSPIPAPFARRPVSPEALAIAAEQLWASKETRIPESVNLMLTGGRRSLKRPWRRLGKLLKAIRAGKMRPRNIAENVALFRKRERLVTLIERPPR